uniref:Knl1 C-terminal RWD domain-containing protein n=1 Tax=Oreochromis aureus TaxID=47969 RepID=A0AAZ1XGR1_OREAU
MEPLDPPKNNEGSGFSKRRLSSILKAPRKSARFADQDQQENVVERVKPVEKRNSRRVSFAPANDVLLFSKDVKNGSPVRSPLQEIITATGATTTQNRVQVGVTEDGSEIIGMETLLNAPLHVSQQKDKATGDDFGEKTVMFSTEDAAMDMTQSHTINIAADIPEDIPLDNYDIFPVLGENRLIDDKATVLPLSTGRNVDVSTSLSCLDPGFENFLASLSKPSGQSTNAVNITMTLPAEPSSEETKGSLVQIKTQRPNLDKENQVPVSVSALMEKTPHNTRKTGESSYRSALCPEDDVSMDMTEAQTGRILGVCDDDDNPFQCLFPTQDMYTHSQMKRQQSSKASGLTNPKDKVSLINPLVPAPHQRHKVSSDAKNECREKTVVFAGDDEFMDMTGCHTVNIACGPLVPEEKSADIHKENLPLNTTQNVREPFKGITICPELDMDMTEAQTGHILEGVQDDPFQFLFPPQDMYTHCLKKADSTSGQRISEALKSSNHKGIEASSSKALKNQNKPDIENNSSDKTVRFSADDACMDVTRSHTVNIHQLQVQSDQNFDFLPAKEKTLRFTPDDSIMDKNYGLTTNTSSDSASNSVNSEKKQDRQICDLPRNTSLSAHSLDPGSKNLTASSSINPIITKMTSNGNAVCPEGDISMDMTEAQTGYILEGDAGTATDARLQDLFPTQSIHPQSGNVRKADWQNSKATGLSSCKGKENFLKTSGNTKVQRQQVKLNVEDDCKEKTVVPVTQSLTVNIVSDLELQSHQDTGLLPANGEKTVRFSIDDAAMDVTRSHTVNIATDVNLLSDHSLPLHGEKTVRFGIDDAAMDVTRSHTVNIATDVNLLSDHNSDLLPPTGEKTVRFSTDDAAMEVTRSHTVNIATNLNLQSDHNSDLLPPIGEKTVRFSTDDAAMEVTRSHTVNIATDVNLQSDHNSDLLPPTGEKTVRFSTDDAAMEVTRSHTVNIATNLNLQSDHNSDLLPPIGEKTVRFGTDDAAMEVTRSHTVNIATNLNLQPDHNSDLLPPTGEKTVRFNTDDAAMDMTRSHTVNIINDLQLESHQNTSAVPPSGEKTVRFTTSNPATDVTRSRTVKIATDFDKKLHQNVDFPPTSEEKTVRFNANDGAMDMTECLTISIPSVSAPDLVLPLQKVLPIQEIQGLSFKVEKSNSEARGLHGNISSSAHEFKNLSNTSGLWTDIKQQDNDIPSPQKATDPRDILIQLKTQKPAMNPESEAPGLVSSFKKKPVSTTMMDCTEINVSMDMTEAQTGCILGQTCTDDPLQCLSSTQDPNSDLTQRSGDLVLSNPDDQEIVNVPDSLNSNERENTEEPEPRTTACLISQDMERSPNFAAKDADALCSRKSRRISLADIQSKVRRLSHMISAAPSAVGTDNCTAPLHHLEQDLEKNSKDKTLPVTVAEAEMELVNTEDNARAQCFIEAEHPSDAITTTPFSSKTKQLMSRISLGGFKPKLPQKFKPDESKRVKSSGQHTKMITVNVAKEVNTFDGDVSDIYDEELGSYEDMSETLDTRSPQKSPEFNMVEPLEDTVFEDDVINPVHGQKRLLPEDKTTVEDQKRMKASCETVEVSEVLECDSNITTAHTTTQTIDSSSNHTASIKCETASESTFKHSLFESQLEDSAVDVQMKLKDGTITVSEFFKLFGIDFVIHNPRESVLPGRFLSDTEASPMDLLKDQHISRPKQMVYETDVFNLTGKVEGLKVRMRDLNKPLNTVNRSLWEDMRYASDKELKSFGAKLKERNNFFRKTSKVQSHEMKEVLYSNLVQANLEEQQKLRGRIQEADEMIKTLDDCICELETELSAVEEKGFEDKPSLKSLQEEMKRVTETTADNERQISELEMQKKQNSSKVKRLRAETRNLEIHMGVLNMMNEWKLREMRDNCRVFTFLHETMHLQLVFEKANGNDAGTEQKITHITFKLELDDEKSQCHARLVHKLISEYIEGESCWVKKYPTRRQVPKLLHDVSLVVSRCRLLGEELRLLKLWGGLRLDILDISCMDTKVRIVFSSLKKFSKFEVVFAICLINHFCVLQVESFKNIIGSTTIQQIEDIVASFTPAKNLLTKTVRKIHEVLLC